MRRLPVLAVLVVSAVIGLSVWLVIEAQSDPEPLAVDERLPRDDEQAQQEQSQAEPEPGPDEEGEEQAVQQEPPDEETTEAETEQDESEPEAVAEPPPDPVDVIVEALDIERPVVPREAPTPVIHVLAEGETLSDVADRYGLALADLIEVNSLETPDLVDVGRELVLPLIAPPAEPPLLMNEVAPGMTDEGVVYGTVHDHERGVINTVVVALAQSDPDVWLAIACVDDVRRAYLMGLPTAEGLSRVYWRTDDAALQSDRWLNQGPALESGRPQLLLDLIYEIRTVWMRVGTVDMTFRVESMLPIEIEYNLDNCGR